MKQDLNRDSNKTLKQSKLEPTAYALYSINMLLRLKLSGFYHEPCWRSLLHSRKSP